MSTHTIYSDFSSFRYTHLCAYMYIECFPGGSVVKNLLANAGDTGLIPGSRRSSGKGNGNLLQYSCLGNSMDRGAWRVIVYGVTKEFSSVHFSRSVVSASLQPHESKHTRPPCPSPTPRVHRLRSIKSVMPSSHLILCRPLLLLPPISPSIRVFSHESTLCMRWPKYWSFSFSMVKSILL